MNCPVCGSPHAAKGLAIHMGVRHPIPNRRRKCNYDGDNRGWCVIHDASWRIDRRRCEAVLGLETA